jgi:dihydropyrimidinase
VWDAVANGTITVISSDHAPSQYHNPLGKKKPLHDYESGRSTVPPSFANTPNGLPGIETRLPLLFSAATDGTVTSSARTLTLPKFVALTSTNPARMYGLAGRKGSIAPGYDADLVIWYPIPRDNARDSLRDKTAITITNDMLHHGIDYTPFEGFEVTNWPRYVLLRGEVKWNRDLEVAGGNGKGILGQPGDGVFLKRAKGEVLVGRTGGEPEGMKTGERRSWM